MANIAHTNAFLNVDTDAINNLAGSIKAAPDNQVTGIIQAWLIGVLPDEHVRPGDVISASFINGLVDRIAALETKVKALEDDGSEPPVSPSDP